MSRYRPVIGWRERVAIPAWGIESIIAKIDTGARTSSIHADDIVVHDDNTVSFTVIRRKRPRHEVHVHTPLLRRATIRSSNGQLQQRYTVAAEILLGPIRKTIEITLSSRHDMLRRMLLGRTALGGVLVDASIDHQLHPRRRRAERPSPECP